MRDGGKGKKTSAQLRFGRCIRCGGGKTREGQLGVSRNRNETRWGALMAFSPVDVGEGGVEDDDWTGRNHTGGCCVKGLEMSMIC